MLIVEILTEEVKDAIIAHAKSLPTEEVCGFVLNDLTVVPVNNIADDRTTGFTPDDESWILHQDNVALIYHSHWCDSQAAELSPRDIFQSRFWDTPYAVVHTETERWDAFSHKELHPFPLEDKGLYTPDTTEWYLNHRFVWSRADCAWLIRAYYRGILNHDMPDYPRPIDGMNWWSDESQSSVTGQFYDFLAAETSGLTLVNTDKLKKHDVLLIRWAGSRIANHAAIYLGDKKILHTVTDGTFSHETAWGGSRVGTMLHSVFRLLTPR